MASKPSESSENTPWFWIIGGPNGSGKSTWVSSEEKTGILGKIPILNPDNFVAPYTNSPLSLIAAGRHLFDKINNSITSRESFAIETTLSGTHYLRLADKLKQNGWLIGAVYIGVDGEDVCVSRVKERALLGGHDVPVDDIVRRYGRSLAHLPKLLDICNYLIIFDNSKDFRKMLEYKLEEQKVIIETDISSWLNSVIKNYQKIRLR